MPFDANAHIAERLVGRQALPFNGAMVDAPAPGRSAEESRLDALVLAVARDRDRGALAALFNFYGPRIKAYLMRRGCPDETAEEVVQEVMVTLWRRADRFDPSQAGATTWIFTIARNKRIDFLRRERRPEVDPTDPALQPEHAIGADRTVETAQDAERLRVAMGALPDEQKALIKMAFFEDKAHSTIAEEQNLPLGTVKSRIRLAMARLRKNLEDA